MAINVGDILASFRVIDEATEPLNQIAGAQREVEVTLKRLTQAYASAAGPVEDWNKLAEQFTGMPLATKANDWASAVEAIGGATRLTAQEQKQVNAVMTEALAKYQALGIEAPKAISDMAEATKGAATATASWSDGITKWATGFALGLVSIAAAQKAFGFLKDTIAEGISMAAEAELTQNRLAVALKNIGAPVEQNIQAYKDMATALSQSSMMQDDAILSAMALATSLGVIPSQMQKVMQAATDLSAATGRDLDSSLKMIVKGGEGSVKAFENMGVSFDNARVQAEGLDYVVERLNDRFGGTAASQVDTYAGKLDQLAKAYDDLKKAMGEAIIQSKGGQTVFAALTDELRGMNIALANSGLLWAALTQGAALNPEALVELFLKFGKAAQTAGADVEDGFAKAAKAGDKAGEAIEAALKEVTKSVDAFHEKQRRQQEAAAEVAARAIEKAAQATREFYASLRAMDALPTWQKINDAIRKTPPLLEDVEEAVEGIPPMLDRMKNSTEDVLAQMALLDAVPDWKKIADSIREVPPLLDAIGEATEGVPPMLKRHVDKTTDMLGGVVDTMNLLSRAAEMMGKTTTAAMLSVSAAIVQGFASGGAVGAWFAGVGTLLAMAQEGQQQAHALWLKAQAEKEQRLASAMAKYDIAFSSMSASFQGNVLGKQLEELILTFMALRDETGNENYALAQMAGSIEDMAEAYRKAGLAIPQELQAILTDLEAIEVVQLRIADLQEELAKRQVMDWERAEEIIAKYGGTLETLGKDFVAAKQMASWKEVWDDWQTLIDMGGDVGGVLVTMKDEIQDLVQLSLKIGTEIPKQFEPLIAELIRTGQLFDANGKAITDIAQLKFGAPLISEVDKIIAAIDRLIEVLTKGLTNAINTVPKKLDIDVGAGTPDGAPSGAGESSPPSYAHGTGGFMDFGSGTLAMLHGREAVVPAGQSLGGQPIQITVISQLDGKEVARNQVRYLPSQLTLAGR